MNLYKENENMEKKWWHDKFVYQIYPKSFKDDNNDGIGDIKGIISKLDYLHDLGVDILWLTPFFTSPMVDNGYDIADYCDINPLFGTMEDMDLLINEAKKRDIYIMMDMVANHCSSEHRWFKEAIKSKDNPYHDYFIFRDKPMHPEHKSCFGGEAWEYVESLNQYYFHEFAKEQPDLNFDNPKIMEEIENAINFWMKKGIRGIRFDVIHMIGKQIDNGIYGYGPKLHERVQELYRTSYGNYDIITVGEAWGNLNDALDFTLPERNEFNMVFQFECTSSTNDNSRHGKFTPKPIDMKYCKDTWIKYQNGLNLKSWNALFVENHDLGRCINRFGSVEFPKESAKAIATMIYFQKGTPYIYQGQEIGMMNIRMDSLSDYNDVEVHGAYKDYVLGLKDITHEDFMEACYKEARDNARTPFQWDNTINAGFNLGTKPWLKINPNYTFVNALDEMKDSDSILNYYKELIHLRKNPLYKDTFVYGTFTALDLDNRDIFLYKREYKNQTIIILVNMTDKKIPYTIPFEIDKVLLKNYNKEYDHKDIVLSPYEAIVYLVK